jgi:hypothetical protein
VDISEGGLPFPEPIVAGNRLAEPDDEGGWKLVAGYRPLRVVGVEVQLFSFGAGNAAVYGGTSFYSSAGPGPLPIEVWERESHLKARPEGQVLSALLFIPEALTRVDVYGKAGVAHFDESTSARASECAVRTRGPGQGPCYFTSQVDEAGSAPYVGIGARFKVGRSWGVRLEYESIDSDVWDETTMLSAGIALEF